jgi:hypothetical protein
MPEVRPDPVTPCGYPCGMGYALPVAGVLAPYGPYEVARGRAGCTAANVPNIAHADAPLSIVTANRATTGTTPARSDDLGNSENGLFEPKTDQPNAVLYMPMA